MGPIMPLAPNLRLRRSNSIAYKINEFIVFSKNKTAFSCGRETFVTIQQIIMLSSSLIIPSPRLSTFLSRGEDDIVKSRTMT
jgi:hypothetical protein